MQEAHASSSSSPRRGAKADIVIIDEAAGFDPGPAIAATMVFFEAGHWWPDEAVLPAQDSEDAPAEQPAGVQPGNLHAPKGGVDRPIPGLKTASEQNCRDHWRTSSKRHKQQKEVVTLALRGTVAPMMLAHAPLVVTMTRISPGTGLDSDNAVSSMKYVRDAIAKVLGCDDGIRETRVEWRVDQQRGPWGIRIRIELKDGKGESGGAG